MNNNEEKKNNNNNSSEKKEDNIVSMKPQAIKMDILLFKNEVLREIKQIEKGIIEKSKETNDILKNKINLFDHKMSFINQQINSVSDKMINGIKMEEKINTLNLAREQLADETTTNKIKITMLEKEMRDSINRIDELLKQTVIYPGIIGINGKFRSFHEFIDFVLAESNTNNTFRQKNIMDLSSYKLKIEKSLQTLGFKIDSIQSSCNSFTLRKAKELQEKFDYSLGQYKDKLNELRIENSNYVIQLETDTKDLRTETNIIKSMKDDIFSKVDNDVNNMKKEQLNIIDVFQGYKKDFEKMNQNLKRLESNIESLMAQRIMLLFEEQKKINENIEELQKEKDDFLNNKINDKIKDIVSEQIKNALKDINVNIKQVNLNNNFNNDDYNNINVNNIKDKNNIRKTNFYSGKINFNNNINNNTPNNISNNIPNNINNINNKMSIYASPRKNNNENDNYNLNNYNYNGNTGNNLVMNRKFQDNINNNYYKFNRNIINNNINENILYELKSDNLINVKKTKNQIQLTKKHSFQSDSNYEDKDKDKEIDKETDKEKYIINDNINSGNIINNKNDGRVEQNVNKYSIISRNKKIKKHKIKYKFKNEKENDHDQPKNKNYIKVFNINKNKISKRRSFNEEKIEDLQKFQKLLKININDLDAKLNNLNNASSSFEILNENAEIFDRFADSNIIAKDNINNNINENKNKDFNKINIFSPLTKESKNNNTEKNVEKNLNEEELSTKNIMASKTATDFYSKDQIKKIRVESSLRPIKNKKMLHNNKLIHGNNSILIKKTNNDLFNLQSNLKSRTQNVFNQNTKVSTLGATGDNKQSDDSTNKCHNYFIGFQFGGSLEDTKKIKKTKRKNKSSKYHK